MRKVYQYQFEQIQKEIIRLKLQFDIYDDELDLLAVRFCYAEDCKDKIERIEKAWQKREVRWLRKEYSPAKGYMARYIGQVLKEISDPWLMGLYQEHLINRQGLIECPWPMKLQDGRE